MILRDTNIAAALARRRERLAPRSRQRGFLLNPFRFGAGGGGGGGAYEAVVLADSPLVYFRMDEASGTTMNDYSGNARHGSYVGAVSLHQPAISLHADAYSLGLSSSPYGLCTDAALARTNNFSLECWFKATNFTGRGALISRSRGGYYMRCNAGAFTFFASQVGGGGSVAGVFSLNTPYHVVVTMDGSGNFVGYINATQVFTGTLNTLTTGVMGGTAIGCDAFSAWNTEQFDGTIDSVAIYGAPLSAARVLAHYNAGI